MKAISGNNLIGLVILVFFSTLLAIPGGIMGYIIFVDGLSELQNFSDPFGILKIFLPVTGFYLLFGYYYTLITKRISPFFWSVSATFNIIGFLIWLPVLLGFISLNSNSFLVIFPLFMFLWCGFVGMFSLNLISLSIKNKTSIK